MTVLSFLQNTRYVCATLFLISIFLGSVALAVLPPFPFVSDSIEYDTAARELAEKHNFIPRVIDNSIHPPGYPYYLATIFTLFGHDFTAVFASQFLLLGFISCIAFLIARDFLGTHSLVAFGASVTILLWPYFLLYSMVAMTEILFTVFLILAVYMLLRAVQEKTTISFVIAGGVAALATLTRPSVLLLPFWIAGLYFLVTVLRDREVFPWLKLWLKSVSAGIGTYVACLLPWILVASLAYGQFVPVASNLTNVLEKGNSTLAYLDNGEKSNAPNTIKDVAVAKLKNVYLFWNPGASGYNMEALTTRFPAATILIWAYQIGFFVILALAGLSFLRPTGPILLLGSIILYFWALHTVLFPYPRYTLPIIPLVIILAFVTIGRYFVIGLRETLRPLSERIRNAY